MISQAMLQEFDLDPGLIHLNHAAMAPWPLRSVQAINAFARENAARAGRHYSRWLETEQRLRSNLALLINAPTSDDIALVPSTSSALSLVAYGLAWKRGDNVVISDEEFPSNKVVWESLEKYGVSVRYANLWQHEIPEQGMLDLINNRTRVVAVSSVQYKTGIRLDLGYIGGHCRQKGVLFCVDGIQSLGAVSCDVQRQNIDFIMADGHKWLLGPEGLALFYCRPELRGQLDLKQYGWHMLDDFLNFDQTTWQAAASAQRFEPGSPNMLAIHALDASISLLLEAGIPQVEREILAKNRYLMDLLREIGDYDFITPEADQRRAGILVVKHRTGDNNALYRYLQENNVYCALRGGNIRFSPHFYTANEKLDALAALLKRFNMS